MNRIADIDSAFDYCITHDRWPEGFNPFNAIRDLLLVARQWQAREGLFTVYDHQGRYQGCIGSEAWAWLVEKEKMYASPTATEKDV